MATRLWRIYMSAPDRAAVGGSGGSGSGASGDKRIPPLREVYLTTVSAPSADAALTKYNRLYGAVTGIGEYAIEDTDSTSSRLV